MNSTHSIIDTIVERIRFFLNNPSTDKYNNDYVVRHLLNEKWCEVIGALNLNSENPVTLKLEFSLATDEKMYHLPPMVGNIRRVVQYDETTDRIISDWVPENELHPYGFGWRINGSNVFEIDAFPTEEQDWSIEYIPTGDGLMNRGVLAAITSASSVTLPASPVLGLRDRRENAYAGWIIRLIPPDGTSTVQERLIESYDAETRIIVPRIPFTLGATYDIEIGNEDVVYEITPPSYLPLIHAVAAKVAMAFGPSLELSQKKMMMLDVEYQNAIKSVRDLYGNRNERATKGFQRYTLDNPNTSLDPYRG